MTWVASIALLTGMEENLRILKLGKRDFSVWSVTSVLPYDMVVIKSGLGTEDLNVFILINVS